MFVKRPIREKLLNGRKLRFMYVSEQFIFFVSFFVANSSGFFCYFYQDFFRRLAPKFSHTNLQFFNFFLAVCFFCFRIGDSMMVALPHSTSSRTGSISSMKPFQSTTTTTLVVVLAAAAAPVTHQHPPHNKRSIAYQPSPFTV